MRVFAALAVLLLIGSLSAAITVNYTGTAASIKSGSKYLAYITLMNPVTFNGTDYFLQDCDILSCRVLLNITPAQSWTLSPSNHINGKVAKSINGFTSANAVLIREDTTEQYQEPTYTTALLNYTAYNNTSGTNYTVFYNGTVQNGTITLTRNVTHWNTLNDGVTLTAGVPIVVALDYKRSKVNDIADLVPSLFGLDMSNWAWWNTTYLYKYQVNISNFLCAQSYCQFPMSITMNTSISNGTDIRVVDSTESSLIPFWRQDGWNYATGAGSLWINATNNTSQVYVYYGASGAVDFSDGFSVFKLFHYYNTAAINTTQWTTSGSVTVSGGYINIAAGGAYIISNKTVGTDIEITYSRSNANANDGYYEGMSALDKSQRWMVHDSSDTSRYSHSHRTGDQWDSFGSAADTAMHKYVFTYSATDTSVRNLTYDGAIKTVAATQIPNITTMYLSFGDWWGYTGTGAITLANVTMRSRPTATPSFTISGQQAQPIPPSAAYIRTAIQAYNGTHITYNFTAIVENLATNAGALTNANISITANGSLVGSKLANISAGGADATLTATWLVARGNVDSNFTAVASISAISGTAQDSAVIILPIDPPSAMATKHPLYAPILTSWNPLQWVWGQLYANNITMTGTPYSWTWATVNRGAGTKVRNGTAQSWAWVAQ